MTEPHCDQYAGYDKYNKGDLFHSLAAPLAWVQPARRAGAYLRRPKVGDWQRGHDVVLLTSGTAYFDALCEAIDAAQSEVLLETYIFKVDAAGGRVAQALEAAALRGVRVYVRLDGFGSADFAYEWRARLERAGVVLHIFNPPRWYSWFYTNYWRRLHRKLVVVDAQIAFCGGMNIIDDYYDDNLGSLPAPRLDFTVRVTGPLVQEVRALMWGGSEGQDGEAEAVGFVARDEDHTKKHSAALTEANAMTKAAVRAAFVVRDNVRYRRRIESVYLRAIKRARREVLIANAYFVPGLRLRRALLDAAARGVQVTLMVHGLYEGFMAHHAAQAVLGVLLRGGVRVVRYEASHYHGKVAVVDQRWATVGSSNLDPISLLLAQEANVVVQDGRFAKQLRREICNAIAAGGKDLTLEELKNRSWFARAGDWLAYALMNVLIAASGNRFPQ